MKLPTFRKRSTEFEKYIDGLTNFYGNVRLKDLSKSEQIELLSSVFIDDIEFDTEDVFSNPKYKISVKLYDLVNDRISPSKFKQELCDHLHDAYEDQIDEALEESYNSYYNVGSDDNVDLDSLFGITNNDKYDDHKEQISGATL